MNLSLLQYPSDGRGSSDNDKRGGKRLEGSEWKETKLKKNRKRTRHQTKGGAIAEKQTMDGGQSLGFVLCNTARTDTQRSNKEHVQLACCPVVWCCALRVVTVSPLKTHSSPPPPPLVRPFWGIMDGYVLRTMYVVPSRHPGR